jgi:hypothetical protein
MARDKEVTSCPQLPWLRISVAQNKRTGTSEYL